METICRAVELLEERIGRERFEVILTISGTENKYARTICSKWGHLSSLSFAGYMSREDLYQTYASTDCLLFPSRIETWGLPISEFLPYGRAMLLADLPYAHETSRGATAVGFFPPTSHGELAIRMEQIIKGDISFLTSVPTKSIDSPHAADWAELFRLLME